MRFTFFCFLFISIGCFAAYAQQDTTTSNSDDATDLLSARSADSATSKAKRQDFIEDSIAMLYLRPDLSRRDQFMSYIQKNSLLNISSPAEPSLNQRSTEKIGQLRNSRDPWVIEVIIGLLIYTALLNVFLSGDIKSVVQSLYNKHALSQVDREGGPIKSWAFIGLFLLFSLTSGLVLYQLSAYYNHNIYFGAAGFQLFIYLSLLIALLFAVKFIVLKFIGFIFDVNRLVSEYIGILNLTYFNIGFVLLLVALCFSLLAGRFIPGLLIFALVSIVVIFMWQYLRNSVIAISNFRFHKFYLFVYLCALEICPVLILIKALDI